MEKRKAKAYRFLILVSVLSVILTGVNYALFRVTAMGVAFIIAIIGSIDAIVCYTIEKRNQKG